MEGPGSVLKHESCEFKEVCLNEIQMTMKTSDSSCVDESDGMSRSPIMKEEFGKLEDQSLPIKTEEYLDESSQLSVVRHPSKAEDMNDQTEDTDDWKCQQCPKKYTTERGLKNHLSRVHRSRSDSLFYCDICGSAQSSSGSLRKHLYRTHKESLILRPDLLTKKCEHCSGRFATHSNLYDHIRKAHQTELDMYLSCSLCNALLKTKGTYNRHVTRSHPEQKDKYLLKNRCNVCGETFKSYNVLKRHKKDIHPGPTFQCDKCSKAFKKEDAFQSHLKKHQERMEARMAKEAATYSCGVCGMIFSYEKNLRVHIKRGHEVIKRTFKCPTCGDTFQSSAEKRSHYRSTHMKERMKRRCNTCQKTFDSPEECREHKKTHDYSCEVCSKVFGSSEAVREHSRVHVEPRHECPVCLKKFVQSSNMKRHLRIHTGERPFKCTHCDRTFSDRSACKSHILVHKGTQRHECQYCGVVFAKRQRLRYHLRSHTGEGLISCCLCDRIFTNSYPLRRHIEGHAYRLQKILKNMGFSEILEERPCCISDVLGMMGDEHVHNYFVKHKKGSFIKVNDNDVPQEPVVKNSFQIEHGIELPMEPFQLDRMRSVLSAINIEKKLDSYQKLGSFLRYLFKVPEFAEYEARNSSVFKTGMTPKNQSKEKQPNEFVEQCLQVVINTEGFATCDSDESEEIGVTCEPSPSGNYPKSD